MYLIDTCKYDDCFLLAKILEKVDITDEEKKKLFKHFEKPEVVDAESGRHGHWVHGKELSRDYIGDVCVSIHYDKCWCSECNYTVEGSPLLWMYCPICGAKMDEVTKNA